METGLRSRRHRHPLHIEPSCCHSTDTFERRDPEVRMQRKGFLLRIGHLGKHCPRLGLEGMQKLLCLWSKGIRLRLGLTAEPGTVIQLVLVLQSRKI